MPVARIQPVPQIRAQIRMIMLGLPGTAPQLTGDRGTMHPHAASDLGTRDPPIMQVLDLDSILNGQVTVMCGQGSATLRLSA